jgi:hypothetical protein
MGSRTTNVTQVINPVPPPPPPPVFVQPVIVQPTVVERVVVDRRPAPPPPPPPPRQVVTSGRVSGAPLASTISNTTVSSPAWATVPFVPNFSPPQTFSQPVVNSSLNAKEDIVFASAARTIVCEDILTDASIGEQNFNITGNGGATRFRFSVRGAPTNVVVVNLSTGETVDQSAYTVQVRSDSFAFLVFDTPPANNVNLRITFTVGDSGILSTVVTQKWNDWQSQIREIENRLSRVRNAVNNSTYIGGNTTVRWGINDPTLIGDAEQAVRNLKSATRRPGLQINTAEIATICDYLNTQLLRIENQLTRTEFVGGVLPATGGSPVYRNTDITITSRIYQNDVRFNYFVGPSNAAIYNPPNTIVVSQQRWVKRFDNISGRFFYSIV